VDIVADDERGRADLTHFLDDASSAAVYTCGPATMLAAVAAVCERARPVGGLHVERFSPTRGGDSVVAGSDAEFEVELAQSEFVVRVACRSTVLEAVRVAGVDVPSSCEHGICGTCETKVLTGEVDHRDYLLTEAEKADGCTMMICVSRTQPEAHPGPLTAE
jgi:ferredoxin